MTSKETSELRFYNYRTRQLATFRPRGERVGLYTCGPTVYGPAHIGNLRTYLFEDILRRTLEYRGYQVTQVMNITDVEDKIIREAGNERKQIGEFTQPYTDQFLADLERLQIRPPTHLPRATDHIPQMIALIEQLLAKGLAYRTDDGSVYFSIRQFPEYGQMIDLDLTQLKRGTRVEADEYDKEAAEDFALWKAVKAEDRAVGAVWPSPWGEGRPGWHIECSAMSRHYLGDSFDIHTGGIDNLFPHHVDEVAQSEGATGQRFAEFFLEAEHLLVENQKMAKSLGNVYTLADIIAKGINPLAFRYLVLGAHYRTKLNFTWATLQGAAATLANLQQLMYRPAEPVKDATRLAIDAAVADDLNVPRVLGLLHEANNPALWHHYDAVLGLGLKRQTAQLSIHEQELLTEREVARIRDDFARADAIRHELQTKGWDIEDTPNGPRLIPR